MVSIIRDYIVNLMFVKINKVDRLYDLGII